MWARRASLLWAGGPGLGRAYQRWPTGDHKLRDAVGRCGLCVHGKTSSLPLMKKGGGHRWAPRTPLNVLKSSNDLEVLGKLSIPVKERLQRESQYGNVITIDTLGSNRPITDPISYPSLLRHHKSPITPPALPRPHLLHQTLNAFIGKRRLLLGFKRMYLLAITASVYAFWKIDP